MKMSFANKV